MAEDETHTAPAIDENATGGSAQKAKTESAETEGVSAQPDFGIGPNPEYYVTRPDDIFTQLQSIIANSRSGVFGLTGVRGAGKSVLLKKIEKEFKGKHHTLKIPAPVSSKVEAAFFAMLFQELCRSVIDYINTEILKRKTRAELIAQGVVKKLAYPMLIILPVLATVAYGIWFYGTFYRDYVKEEQSARPVYRQQLNELNTTHELGLGNIVSAVKDNILATARKALRENEDTLKAKEKAVNERKRARQKARKNLDDSRGQLDFLYRLRSWEGRFSREFAVWSKAIGDMPHPVHVIIYDRQGREKGDFFLEEFASRRKTSLPILEKKLGISVSEERSLLRAFRVRAFRDDRISDPRNYDRWFSKITLDERFSSIRKTLAISIRDQETTRSKARKAFSESDKELIKAQADLAQETKKAAIAAGETAKKSIEAADEEAGEAAKEIRIKAESLETALSRWSDLLKTFEFEFLSPDTWLTFRMPTEKITARAKKDNLVEKVKTTHETFDSNLKNSFPDVEGVANASSQHMERLRAAVLRLSRFEDRVDKSEIWFYRVRDLRAGPLIVGGIVIGVGLFLGAVIFWFLKFWRTRKHRDVLGLLKQSEDEIRNLEYEVTESRGSTLNLPFFQRLGASFSLSQQQRGRALTLPGLTRRYVEYIHDVQRVLGDKYGSPKLIICIDELDKITDPEQVGNVLREIKGALYEKDCFYLLSISEDAVREFEGRLVEQRDIFESTFDEIMFLERLDLATCLDIARGRCKDAGYGPNDEVSPDILEAMEIASVLSTGVPRELLRNLRAVESKAGRVGDFEPSLAWHALFRRKLRDILKKVRTSTVSDLEIVRADLIGDIEKYLGLCPGGYDKKVVLDSLASVRDLSKKLSDQAAELKAKADTADVGSRAAALESDIELIRAWARCWIELEIHLLVRLCSLTAAAGKTQTRSETYSHLLVTYGGLSYSAEVTSRRLSKMRFPGLPRAAEGVVTNSGTVNVDSQ